MIHAPKYLTYCISMAIADPVGVEYVPTRLEYLIICAGSGGQAVTA